MSKTVEIILCEECRGTGTVDKMVNYHRGEYISEECPRCLGKGRMKKITITETEYQRLEN